MADEKVKVRIKPFKGIGGVGEAGDVVWMARADAEMYFRDGFVEYVEAENTIPPSSQTPPPTPPHLSTDGEGSDHTIMKPQSKRSRRK